MYIQKITTLYTAPNNLLFIRVVIDIGNMPDEITFIDLACLLRITPDTTLEKFGSAINASIYDASNLAGTLKQKSLIDFSSYYPGPNTIVITDAGKALMAEADAKAIEPFDNLDQEILFQISGGKRIPIELQNTLNIRSKDLALRLYKLYKQGALTYELKSGGAALMLTEGGYLKAKGTQQPSAPRMAEQPKPQPSSQPAAQPMQPAASHIQPDASMPGMPDTNPKMMKKLKGNTDIYIAAVVVIVIVAALYYAYTTKII